MLNDIGGVVTGVGDETIGEGWSLFDGQDNAASHRIRKRIEETFGWIMTVAGLCQPKFRGLPKVDWAVTFAAAWDLARVRS